MTALPGDGLSVSVRESMPSCCTLFNKAGVTVFIEGCSINPAAGEGARSALADRARRVAGHHCTGRHVTGHNGAHADHRAVANGYAIDDTGLGTNPDITADAYSLRGHRLLAHQRIGGHAVIEGIEGTARGNAGM